MVAVAIFSIDPILRRNLEQLPHDDPALALVGIVDHPSSVPGLLNQYHVDVLLADAPTRELLAEYRGWHHRVALVVLLDGAATEDGVRALNAGARRPASLVQPQRNHCSDQGDHQRTCRLAAGTAGDIASRGTAYR